MVGLLCDATGKSTWQFLFFCTNLAWYSTRKVVSNNVRSFLRVQPLITVNHTLNTLRPAKNFHPKQASVPWGDFLSMYRESNKTGNVTEAEMPALSSYYILIIQ